MGVIIVGSGPSAWGFVPPATAKVISVNGTISWLHRADYWFSLDPSTLNLSRAARPREGTEYVMAVSPETFLPEHVTRYTRVSARGEEPSPRGTPEWWLWRWSAVLGICKEPGKIHTGNSAFGALGLAYHLGHRKAVLVGIDGTQEERVEGGNPNNLSHLPLLIESVKPDMAVCVVGNLKGDHFRLPLQGALTWLHK